MRLDGSGSPSLGGSQIPQRNLPGCGSGGVVSTRCKYRIEFSGIILDFHRDLSLIHLTTGKREGRTKACSVPDPAEGISKGYC